MLTLTQVTPYLLARGLISPREVVRGGLTVVERVGRNRIFHVLRASGPCYLLKQGVGRREAATVAREAAVYQALARPALVASPQGHPDPPRDAATSDESNGSNVSKHLPRYYAFDPEEQALILELLPRAENARERLTRRARFPRELAPQLGTALAALHQTREPLATVRLPIGDGRHDDAATAERTAAGATDEREPGDLPAGGRLLAQRPWALSLHLPGLEVVRGASGAALRLIEALQRSAALCAALDEVRAGWRPEAQIHGDLRWENCLLTRARPHRGGPELVLVDWEFAGLGDPRWDVGAVFAEYLCAWLCSLPITGEDPPERLIELARYPLDTLQPGIRVFWQTYARRMGFAAGAAFERLVQSITHCAARLIEAAYARVMVSPRLGEHAIRLLQLSLNLVQRPYEGIAHLLGIPLDGPAWSFDE